MAILAALIAVSTSACVASRAHRVRVPAAQSLYVVAFVDMTREGKVGVPLAQAIQLEVYRRDPARLSVVFDDKSVALDGTVVTVEDEAREAGTREVRIALEMVLTRKDGSVVTALAPVATTANYEVHANMDETERLRDEAIAEAIDAAAVAVVDAVDAAGERIGTPP